MISAQADWVMMSLCSAHLEEKHQWGAGVGVEASMTMRRRSSLPVGKVPKFADDAEAPGGNATGAPPLRTPSSHPLDGTGAPACAAVLLFEAS